MLRRVFVALAALLVVAFASASITTAPADAAARCKLSSKEQAKGLGPTYTTSLTVSGTSCNNGKKIVRAHHKCRVKAGGAKGTCKKRVSGYKCSERRGRAIPTQFSATVTCKKSRATVKFAYTQYT